MDLGSGILNIETMYVSLTICGISKYLIKYILQYIQVKYVSLFVALFDKNKCKRASTSFICFLVTKAFSLSKTAQTASTDSIVAAVSTYYTTTPCGPFKYLIYSVHPSPATSPRMTRANKRKATHPPEVVSPPV